MDGDTILGIGGLAAGAVSCITAIGALVYAHKANTKSNKSNTLATEANDLATEANDLAKGSNTIALDARKIALHAEARETETHDVYWEGDWQQPGIYVLTKRETMEPTTSKPQSPQGAAAPSPSQPSASAMTVTPSYSSSRLYAPSSSTKTPNEVECATSLATPPAASFSHRFGSGSSTNTSPGPPTSAHPSATMRRTNEPTSTPSTRNHRHCAVCAVADSTGLGYPLVAANAYTVVIPQVNRQNRAVPWGSNPYDQPGCDPLR